MPGETFLAPPSKIRSFVLRAGIGRLAGLREGSVMTGSAPLAAPIARGQ